MRIPAGRSGFALSETVSSFRFYGLTARPNVSSSQSKPGSVHAAQVESARAVRAAVEICARWIEHDANVHTIANSLERLKEMRLRGAGC